MRRKSDVRPTFSRGLSRLLRTSAELQSVFNFLIRWAGRAKGSESLRPPLFSLIATTSAFGFPDMTAQM